MNITILSSIHKSMVSRIIYKSYFMLSTPTKPTGLTSNLRIYIEKFEGLSPQSTLAWLMRIDGEININMFQTINK